MQTWRKQGKLSILEASKIADFEHVEFTDLEPRKSQSLSELLHGESSAALLMPLESGRKVIEASSVAQLTGRSRQVSTCVELALDRVPQVSTAFNPFGSGALIVCLSIYLSSSFNPKRQKHVDRRSSSPLGSAIFA